MIASLQLEAKITSASSQLSRECPYVSESHITKLRTTASDCGKTESPPTILKDWDLIKTTRAAVIWICSIVDNPTAPQYVQVMNPPQYLNDWTTSNHIDPQPLQELILLQASRSQFSKWTTNLVVVVVWSSDTVVLPLTAVMRDEALSISDDRNQL